MDLSLTNRHFISIHALREEGDAAACGMLPTWSHFYPRPPRGGRPARGPSRRGCRSISIHALREEGDFSLSGVTFVHFDFYPRPPRGGRPSAKREAPTSGEFLSTPSARRATAAGLHRDAVVAISIHALREEGDSSQILIRVFPMVFLSTPSARRATECYWQIDRAFEISIHALREEGDSGMRSGALNRSNFYPRPPRGGRRGRVTRWTLLRKFLSTPSARRATAHIRDTRARNRISIHALREEGDTSYGALNSEEFQFLSTPSARRATRRSGRWPVPDPISIHALREEGDGISGGVVDGVLQFLSTPSARRATAKTETKSLFSNKLYNILHEFRRALIYNGSKSYPNHAK